MFDQYEENRNKQIDIAKNCNKERFAKDVSDRLAPLLVQGSATDLYDATYDCWNDLMDATQIPLFSNSVIVDFLFNNAEVLSLMIKPTRDELRAGNEDLREAYEKLSDESYEYSKINTDIYKRMDKHKYHKDVLHSILADKLKDFDFKRSKNEARWYGAEIDTACETGFGGRTSYKNLEYEDIEQGRDEKHVIITSLAVYFMEIVRAKQSFDFQAQIDKQRTSVDDFIPAADIYEIMNSIENKSY